ncbi:hypothetical protein DVH24_008818 [Malus domestica]|uniref:Uncharacterized protein n=1 Tax=Malus domestica TaxID=3750 RepID=A0A498JR45_MALDO|nr:hypothetical protein DVH24_008818 [Malus domestica]
MTSEDISIQMENNSKSMGTSQHAGMIAQLEFYQAIPRKHEKHWGFIFVCRQGNFTIPVIGCLKILTPRFDCFYYVVAVLEAMNLVYFVALARWFEYKRSCESASEVWMENMQSEKRLV